MSHHKVIILGSGPAGYTAAIYAARANLSPVMIEGYEKGGQLTTTTDVENYPGFPDGVMGPEMMVLFRKQAERFGTQFIAGEAQKVDLSKRPYAVSVGKETYTAETLIISTGASAKYLGLESEKTFLGRGVSACATCDGAFFKGAKVCIIGGGDTAMEEALFLTRFTDDVTVIHRRDEFRASKIMSDRVKNHKSIKILWNTGLDEILGGPKGVEKIRVKNLKTDATEEIEMEGVFIAIGHSPNSTFLESQLETDEVGYIRTKDGTVKTSVEGVFACGDVQDKIYRQAITAAGTGCQAAIEAERFLESQSH